MREHRFFTMLFFEFTTRPARVVDFRFHVLLLYNVCASLYSETISEFVISKIHYRASDRRGRARVQA